uniref:ABC transporter ATP-binding protein n=1 Tax=Deinococcus sp. TaxID=47478 RepID=UPI002869BA2C
MTAPTAGSASAATPRPAVVDIREVRKVYTTGDIVFEALGGVSVQITQGEMVALMGPSGSGKTTLMQIIGLLDRPSDGSYFLGGRDVTTLSENERAEARNQDIGFVFQAFHLLPRLSLVENVEVPLTYAGVPPRERRERAMHVLGRVGLESKAANLPSQISGGQKQRVAIALALAGSPKLLLSD